ncbi:helix-turn-helix domain-containing protein [Limosilactobacillus fermentum]|nr:helix-turn-helix domain-containing protein [Limosilactobacillus fermentum]WCL66604.1 helix-turn-helix domain-containing protein [Limosilactobacillus fermentum]
MSSYNHLTLKDRECILLGVTLKDTYQVIAQRIGCSKATVSHEMRVSRMLCKKGNFVRMNW